MTAAPIPVSEAEAGYAGAPRRARHRGLITLLYVVALLVLAALAVQAGGSFLVAGALRVAGDRVVRHGIVVGSHAGRVHEALAAHRKMIESAATARGDDELALLGLAHVGRGVQWLRDLLHRAAADTTLGPAIKIRAGSDDATLQRVARTLEEFDLTGAAVVVQARDMLRHRSHFGEGDAAALRRSLDVFAISASRLGQDLRVWRQAHWSEATVAAEDMFDTVDTAAHWAVIAGLGTAALMVVGLLVLGCAVRRLDAITGVILRLARHEPDIVIPFHTLPGPVGDVSRAVAVLADDVRELERRGIAQAQISQLLDAALNSMIQGLVCTGPDGRLRIWNQRFVAILGLADGSVRQDMTMRDVLARCTDAAAGALAPPQEPPPNEAFRSDPRSASQLNVVALERAVVIRAHWVRMDDGGWLGTFDDITRLQHSEARLVHLARHDALTDLPNRTALRDAVARAAARPRTATSRTGGIAVLSVNLDRFRTVNDALGHEVGDGLLRQAAARLRQHVRTEDTIARVGADSFAIVQIAQRSSAAAPAAGTIAFAQRLIEMLSEPYTIGDVTVVVGASVGIAIPGPGPVDADALLRNAELARQHARRDGGGTVRVFAPEMDADAQDRRLMELDLRQALERGEFDLHYQPLVSVRSRRICAFEALLRWHHPQRGMVRPDLFIPLAEEVGLIGPIGDWVLRRACAEAAGWPGDIGVAVNLSPVQFTRGGLVEQVEAALTESGLAPVRLELEITERVLLRDGADTLATLHRLRALGVRISMDDFGTGYSSLSYLRSFPFDKIKIDKSFVQDMQPCTDGTGDGRMGEGGMGESGAIVRAIAGLGQSLGIAVTAEGVETVEQLNALVAEGCTEMQGYLFSPPRPANELALLMTAAESWFSETWPVAECVG